MLRFIIILLIGLKLSKSLSRDFSAHEIRFRRVYQRISFHQFCFAGAQTDVLHRSQQSTLFDISDRLASLPCMTDLLTQHATECTVPVSSADAEAERALNNYRPITNWCVLADSLSEESVKELCSAAWNVDLNAMTVHKFTASLQRS